MMIENPVDISLFKIPSLWTLDLEHKYKIYYNQTKIKAFVSYLDNNHFLNLPIIARL